MKISDRQFIKISNNISKHFTKDEDNNRWFINNNINPKDLIRAIIEIYTMESDKLIKEGTQVKVIIDGFEGHTGVVIDIMNNSYLVETPSGVKDWFFEDFLIKID